MSAEHVAQRNEATIKMAQTAVLTIALATVGWLVTNTTSQIQTTLDNVANQTAQMRVDLAELKARFDGMVITTKENRDRIQKLEDRRYDPLK